LPELVVQTTESYEELAIKLTTDEEKLAELRKKLRNNIKSQRLFDMQAYMLEFESALKLMYQQHEKKLSPVAIDVTNISKS
jgi:predicted O-linked N-acetylglucosamine transferase (SPINDLY family)